MSTTRRGHTWELHVDGDQSTVVTSSEGTPDGEWTVVEESIRFECASGDWIEGENTGIPVFELLESAEVAGETTHVQFISREGYHACIPLTDLRDALITVGDRDDVPRFVSPYVVGPRTIKNVAEIRPVALDAGEERESYEDLPIEE